MIEYITNKGMNINILREHLDSQEPVDTTKLGKGFFPGNETLNPSDQDLSGQK